MLGILEKRLKAFGNSQTVTYIVNKIGIIYSHVINNFFTLFFLSGKKLVQFIFRPLILFPRYETLYNIN